MRLLYASLILCSLSAAVFANAPCDIIGDLDLPFEVRWSSLESHTNDFNFLTRELGQSLRNLKRFAPPVDTSIFKKRADQKKVVIEFVDSSDPKIERFGRVPDGVFDSLGLKTKKDGTVEAFHYLVLVDRLLRDRETGQWDFNRAIELETVMAGSLYYRIPRHLDLVGKAADFIFFSEDFDTRRAFEMGTIEAEMDYLVRRMASPDAHSLLPPVQKLASRLYHSFSADREATARTYISRPHPVVPLKEEFQLNRKLWLSLFPDLKSKIRESLETIERLAPFDRNNVYFWRALETNQILIPAIHLVFADSRDTGVRKMLGPIPDQVMITTALVLDEHTKREEISQFIFLDRILLDSKTKLPRENAWEIFTMNLAMELHGRTSKYMDGTFSISNPSSLDTASSQFRGAEADAVRARLRFIKLTMAGAKFKYLPLSTRLLYESEERRTEAYLDHLYSGAH